MSNSSALSVSPDQNFWDEQQLAALRQIGLQNAPKAELAVFLHASQKTGLDPFSRQIYMIERGGRYTIQASIDGLRIVAQRSNNYGGQTPVEWCGEDGVWKDVWLAKTPPAAARVGVYYKDTPNPTYATAKFESYNANTPIWRKMPDLMIAKCAEALALRKAFPNDLSGVYSSEEMEQASPTTPAVVETVVEIPSTPEVKTASPELTQDLIEILETVENCDSLPALKAIFDEHSRILDYTFVSPVINEEITLRMAIMVRKDELSDTTNVK